MGMYIRHEVQQPRPEAALQPRALVARLPVLAARARAAEPPRPEAGVGGRRQRLATAAQVQWKHAPLRRVPRAAGQDWRQRCRLQSLTFVEAYLCVSLLCSPFSGFIPLSVE